MHIVINRLFRRLRITFNNIDKAKEVDINN
jgi:hypothetical protein